MKTRVIALPNGLSVIHKYIPYTRTVHCGFIVDSGSRDDEENEMGMAHFIEHMIFKGTEKRKTFHILNYLESVGGDLNAYTTKEKTCIYASLCAEHFERAVDLLSDIVFHSTFPEKEILKEHQVVSEEIEMYKNVPDDAIFDDFDKLVFPHHNLGNPILGTKQSVRSLTQPKVKRHLRETFVQGKLVFSIVGNVNTKTVEKVVDKYLKHVNIPTGDKPRFRPNGSHIPNQERGISTNQAHEIIGGRAYAMRQEHYVPFLLLNNMLGGPAMNSRLNLNIREKYGLSYNISSFYFPFVDSGIWGVYYACEPDNLNRIRKLVQKELKQLCTTSLGILRLSQAKKQLTGQLTLSHENLLSQMLGMGKDFLDFSKISSFSELVAEIEQVSAQQMLEAANEIMQPQQLATLTYRQVG